MQVGSEIIDWKWSSVSKFLPFDLDGWAVEFGLLQRRRGVGGGEALVRCLLLMGLPNASFARAAAMAFAAGLGRLTGAALFRRLVKAERMLEALFIHSLGHVMDISERWRGLRLLAVDATVLCGPGAKGTDQRLHTVYDLSKGLPVSVDLTGPEGGETLKRHRTFGHGDLLLADSGYGYNRSIHWALRSGARILIRFNFETVKFFDLEGKRIWAETINATVPESGSVNVDIQMMECPHPLRAIGERNPDGKVVWLVTDLSREELPASEVRELYRKRWQIELFFKRLKSLLDLNDLPTRDGPSARAWIWAKLNLATLAVLTAHERFSPWGFPSEQQAPEPLGSLCSGCVGHRTRSTGTRLQTQTRKTQRQAKKARTYPQTVLLLEA